MIFSELYSAYYNTVAKILTEALGGELTEKRMCDIIKKNAFNESVLTVLPALKSGKWQLLRQDMTTNLDFVPTMPLTTLQKRWLTAILLDRRMRLFDVKIEGLCGVEPLFTPEDYKVFDRYADGDDFDNEQYIKNFKTVLRAVKRGKPLSVSLLTRRGGILCTRVIPTEIEYSAKDDKFRVIVKGFRHSEINLGRIITCEPYNGRGPWNEVPEENRLCEVTLCVTDRRNALERVMLHFAHFEKQAEKNADGTYNVTVRYYEHDETELVIRVLSFGPMVKVTQPESFVALIRERLIKQKECGMM